MEIGMKFDTNYETGCIVVALPDAQGNFVGLDSDGVECEFHVSMIINPPSEQEMAAMADADAPDESMDGDHESALASAGFGTDEDYGDYGAGGDFE